MLLISEVSVASLTTWPGASGKSTRMMSSFFVPSVLALCAITPPPPPPPAIASSPDAAMSASSAWLGPQKNVWLAPSQSTTTSSPVRARHQPRGRAHRRRGARRAQVRDLHRLQDAPRQFGQRQLAVERDALHRDVLPRRHQIALAEGERRKLPPVLHRHRALHRPHARASCPGAGTAAITHRSPRPDTGSSSCATMSAGNCRRTAAGTASSSARRGF